MARVVMVLTNPTLKVATSEAGLAAATGYECQVTSAIVTSSVSMNTIPATGCAGPSQSPSAPAYQLELGWLQDWTSPGGGLSGFAQTNAGLPVWWELTPDSADAATKVTGNSWCVPGGLGGTFGDGSAAATTATWPCIDTPDFAVPAAA